VLCRLPSPIDGLINRAVPDLEDLAPDDYPSFAPIPGDNFTNNLDLVHKLSNWPNLKVAPLLIFALARVTGQDDQIFPIPANQTN